jgi:hypothetical protein
MAKDSRIGETLWSEWSGTGYEPVSGSPIVFYTEDHIDLEPELIRRALASALQRDGTVTTLGEGFRAAESGTIVSGFAGFVDEEDEMTVCDANGETFYGDSVKTLFNITWVEIHVGTY